MNATVKSTNQSEPSMAVAQPCRALIPGYFPRCLACLRVGCAQFSSSSPSSEASRSLSLDYSSSARQILYCVTRIRSCRNHLACWQLIMLHRPPYKPCLTFIHITTQAPNQHPIPQKQHTNQVDCHNNQLLSLDDIDTVRIEIQFMCAAMADPENNQRYAQPEYRQDDDYAPQSALSTAGTNVRGFQSSSQSFNPLGLFYLHDTSGSQHEQVSSFNASFVVNSTLTAPVSQAMDYPLSHLKYSPSQWSHGTSMQYPNFAQQPPQSSRMMKSHNTRETALSQINTSQSPPQTSAPELLPYSSESNFDSPNNTDPQTPYFHPQQPRYGMAASSQVPSPALPQYTTYSTAPPLPYTSAPMLQYRPPTALDGPLQTMSTNVMHDPSRMLHRGSKHSQEASRVTGNPMSYQRPGPVHTTTSPQFVPHFQRNNGSPPQSKRRNDSDPGSPYHTHDYRARSLSGGHGFHQLPPLSNQLGQLPEPQHVQSRQPSVGSQHQAGRMGYPLSEAENLLLKLRSQEPALDWKKTTAEFNRIMQSDKKVPALQMQCTRAKEKLKQWSEKDVSHTPFLPNLMCLSCVSSC